jgi:hypothetical protein
VGYLNCFCDDCGFEVDLSSVEQLDGYGVLCDECATVLGVVEDV